MILGGQLPLDSVGQLYGMCHDIRLWLIRGSRKFQRRHARDKAALIPFQEQYISKLPMASIWKEI